MLSHSWRCAPVGAVFNRLYQAVRKLFRSSPHISTTFSQLPGYNEYRSLGQSCLGEHPMPIRVLIAKPGLDGHDRGAKVIARGLRDAGMEVIYTGLRQSPEMIAEAALQEDVDIVGISILSGSHMTLVPAVRTALNALDMSDLPLIIGGIVPEQDQRTLRNQGISAIFSPGARLDKIVSVIRDLVVKASS